MNLLKVITEYESLFGVKPYALTVPVGECLDTTKIGDVIIEQHFDRDCRAVLICSFEEYCAFVEERQAWLESGGSP